jgi:hypothetical protein
LEYLFTWRFGTKWRIFRPLKDTRVIWRLWDNLNLATYWRSQKIPPRLPRFQDCSRELNKNWSKKYASYEVNLTHEGTIYATTVQQYIDSFQIHFYTYFPVCADEKGRHGELETYNSVGWSHVPKLFRFISEIRTVSQCGLPTTLGITQIYSNSFTLTGSDMIERCEIYMNRLIPINSFRGSIVCDE